MTTCTICNEPCAGQPEAGTAFCAMCWALNLAHNSLDVYGIHRAMEAARTAYDAREREDP